MVKILKMSKNWMVSQLERKNQILKKFSDWEAEAEEETSSKKEEDKLKAKVTCKGNKISIEEKIKKREEEAEMAKKLAAVELEKARNMTSKEREQLAMEAELGIVDELFSNAENKPIDSSFINPNNKEEVLALEKKLIQQFNFLEQSPHYAGFASNLIRKLMTPLELEALNPISLFANSLITEKQKALKPKSKKKKGNKLIAERDDAYAEHGAAKDGGDFDDYDDFL
ncbi:Eukaryotic translation initiation factor 3 subunit J [Cichlidogyrus casuarinus]|uniref:Eukaryotic translation initiation factor 3 subunit J n=1 Tax=Cichlidogyrus casuarinus TaxID=1844966 RepID=A0ABD2Q0M1_9PLAT